MIAVPNLILMLVLCFCWASVIGVNFHPSQRWLVNIFGGVLIGAAMKLAGLGVIVHG